MTERILYAAVMQGENVVFLPRPNRHHNVLWLMTDPKRVTQGFVISEGRFVDRIEGAALAKAAGQIAALNWPPYLYSEDLW